MVAVAVGNRTKLTFTDGSTHIIDSSIQEVNSELDDCFFRTRKANINLKYVESVQERDDYEKVVILTIGNKFTINEKRLEEFRASLKSCSN